ncbi:hypothetical protein D9M68_934930 [compost metagenome]
MVQAHYEAHAHAETVFAEAETVYEYMLNAAPSPPKADGPGDDVWQPIETAPKGRLIDIWVNSGGGHRWCDCYFDRECGEWRTSRPGGKLVWVKAEHVTHWRLPPASPKEA